MELRRQPAHRQPDQYPADADDHEFPAGPGEGKRTGRHRHHREAIGDQGGRIVDQTFAFQNGDDAARDAQAFGNRRGGDGVGRGDDRAQNESDRERQMEEMKRQPGDRHRGKEDEPDGEQRNGTEVGAEIAPRGEQRRRKQERRQEEKKNQFRIEPDLGQSGNQTNQQSADDEKDGIRECAGGGPAAPEPPPPATIPQKYQQCTPSCRAKDSKAKGRSQKASTFAKAMADREVRSQEPGEKRRMVAEAGAT